jgi:NitT/TauT family transport system substrate-binding protein
MKRAFLPRTLTVAVLAVAAMVPAHGQTLDKVSFGTNWVAEAEHGGFYQAVADGTYKKYGLDVTIVPGGPNTNNRTLLIAGKLDFFMTANTLQSFDAVANNVPVTAVAAIFQKDPQVFLTHPEVKIARIEDLKPLTLFISKEGVASYFQWLKSEYKFDERKVRPYTFNSQPFLANKQSAMQGYVTSEPYAVEKAAGIKPNVTLLADYGFNAYSTLIETRLEIIDKKPDLVQRFVDDRLVQLSLRRQQGRQCRHQEAQSGNDRRTAGLLRCENEGARHCRFRRHAEGRHRRHERHADGELLRQDGAGRCCQARRRFPQGLYAALHQQGRRPRSEAEELTQWSLPPHPKSQRACLALPCGCAASPRSMTAVWRRWDRLISTSGAASSSRCWGHPDAVNRRRCG